MFVSLQALLQHAKAKDSRAAQVAARDEEGRTALQIATDWRAPKAAKAILEHGPTLAERRAMWGRSDAAGAAATLLCAAFVAGYALGVTCNTMVSIVRTSFGAEEWAHAGFHAMLPALVGGPTFAYMFAGITGLKLVFLAVYRLIAPARYANFCASPGFKRFRGGGDYPVQGGSLLGLCAAIVREGATPPAFTYAAFNAGHTAARAAFAVAAGAGQPGFALFAAGALVLVLVAGRRGGGAVAIPIAACAAGGIAWLGAGPGARNAQFYVDELIRAYSPQQ